MVKKGTNPLFSEKQRRVEILVVLLVFFIFLFCILLLDVCFLVSSFTKGKPLASLSGHYLSETLSIQIWY